MKPPATGFVLPLALSASAVLLLGSASIHTLSLKDRLRLHAAIERDQSWKLLSWQPGPGSGDLRLVLADGRRASFRLELAADGAQILGIRAV